MPDRMKAGALRASVVSHASAYGGIRRRDEKRETELGRTSVLRFTAANHLLSDLWPFPVATQVDVSPPEIDRPFAGLGKNFARRLGGVGNGLR